MKSSSRSHAIGLLLAVSSALQAAPAPNTKPPPGAIVLFDGSNLDAWAKQKEKQWLTEDGPGAWKLLPDGAVEVIPGSGCIISKKQFGDCKVHVEFRVLGAVNSGVFLQARYEVNIKDSYNQTKGEPSCAPGNFSGPGVPETITNAAAPPLEWQTLDIDFQAPRFDKDGTKTANARLTTIFNGVKLYENAEATTIKGAAKRLGEAATGPLMLQEHGSPIQFRNIWVIESSPPAKTAGLSAQARSASAGEFRHPGILLNEAQLQLIKSRVSAGTEPQKSAFEIVKGHELASLSYAPHPWATCECGPRSNPDRGCKDEQRDSEAAYTQALLWYITGNKAYAENAVKILNAWATTLTGGHKLENGPVQAAWCAEIWPRAAEIMRFSYPAWSATEVAKFKQFLANQYVPSLINGSCENGNKELSMSEALINIGVFNDDRAIFDAGVKMWRGRAPAYIYLSSDGPAPVKPADCEMAIWGNKGHSTPLVDGLLQETCRDSGHANMALAAMVNAAETARQQGLDLYAEAGKRIMAALEYQAQFLPPNNAPVPEFLAFNKHPTWEIAYNHLHNRLGYSLPKMAAVLPTNRPTAVNHHMVWETLTHGDIGDVGLPLVSGHP